ncbi:hypothetical protein ZEAMMB73_Zm00001d028119 [Zea mays]|uniref:Uncharacterized protein n=1 Tax=Zea mays TaxID=4577 RepID=A0A1D6JS83_MAIZE|nr:hypothetical protein ZEAMMB73_Zm00001d028119 [Zea mays]ONL94773.1 hypothetical protein ZEAMMB73_Zm00001d028119 [Zea mays]ONL94780.1 hypothetical protein ZEAMMB73_Zm00001d028119 [Zea mays]
MEPPWPSI